MGNPKALAVMRQFLAAFVLVAIPLATLVGCTPDETAANRASPAVDASAFADAVATALQQRLDDIEPRPEPSASSLAIVFSQANVTLNDGKITVTRSRRGNWHIALRDDTAELDETSFLADLERTAIFLPELIRQRRIFRSVATFVAPDSLMPSAAYVLQIDPTPNTGAALRLRSQTFAGERAWTHGSYADSLRRIESFVLRGDGSTDSL